MKKLLVGIVFGAFVLCANAASYKWSGTWTGTYIYGPDGTSASVTDVTAYLYCDAIGASPIDSASVTPKSVLAGVIAERSISVDVDYNTEYSFYVTLIANYEGKQYTFSTKDNPSPATSPTAADVEDGAIASFDLAFNLKEATKAPGAWTAVNVPEPTSGLLLLCGLAGLALRRKRV